MTSPQKITKNYIYENQFKKERRRFLEVLLKSSLTAASLGLCSSILGCVTNPIKNRKLNSVVVRPVRENRIAIVGTRATGNSAAQYLRKLGYYS